MALVYRRVDRVFSGGGGAASGGAGGDGTPAGSSAGAGDGRSGGGEGAVPRSADSVGRPPDPGREVCEGDCLLLETAGTPGTGDLALVRAGGVESLCRWDVERPGELIGIVVGIRRRL
ncbi:MAG: hypothetical protein PHQ19_09995 [Candidatus Krumholzibacteria bacterium]|nr:hypothetical protein [Candidatus Krumholzibacteria bacterium]